MSEFNGKSLADVIYEAAHAQSGDNDLLDGITDAIHDDVRAFIRERLEAMTRRDYFGAHYLYEYDRDELQLQPRKQMDHDHGYNIAVVLAAQEIADLDLGEEEG